MILQGFYGLAQGSAIFACFDLLFWNYKPYYAVNNFVHVISQA